jgi:VWFA-related protein
LRTFLALLLLCPGLSGAEKPVASLPEKYRLWLEEVEPLITKAEREAFLKLEKDYQREAFIERFWQVRDPYPDTARNEFRDAWEARRLEARQLFEDPSDERYRFYLLNGPPAVRQADQCGLLLWPTEVWIYPPNERIRDVLILIFYQRFRQGKFRLWYPSDGLAALMQAAPPNATESQLLQEILERCIRSDTFAGAIAAAVRRGQFDYSLLVSRASEPLPGPAKEWVSTFTAYSTDLPENAETLSAELSVSYPSKRQQRTVLQGTILVPADQATRAEFGGANSFNFYLNGEVLREGKLFESFRYRFDLPASSLPEAQIPLIFERYLRPGPYTLILRLEDLNGKRFWRHEATVTVPEVVNRASAAEPEQDFISKLIEEANQVLVALENSIRIVPPRGDFLSGFVRFDTLTVGEEIAEVEFQLDDRPILRKSRPPFSVELDLGQIPATRRLRAVAFNHLGHEVASDEILLNASSHRFSVRLVEPRKGQHYTRSLRAEARVEVPEGLSLDRVEFYRNETLVATAYQEPFTQVILLPENDSLSYVRAVAYLEDGNSTEDLVFVNAPGNLDEVEVQFVELYTTAVDRNLRPVPDLRAEEVTILEDGVPQSLARFAKVQDLPLHLGILLDTSASMEPNLSAVRHAVLKFLEEILLPKDRAALFPFNDRPILAARLTNDPQTLASALAGLRAERGTALYDSIVYALFYFNGLRGQRALIVFSDGKDENSRLTLEQTLDFARRAGISIYTIGYGLSRGEREARRALERLAKETGGRSFFPQELSEVSGVYRAIESELRNRYLLAYQSTNTRRDQKFRKVEVKSSRPGVELRTIRGYYP